MKEGQTEIASVFTFSQNHYAYQDKIDCHDGHIYWIAQANVSGNVTDHYTFIDYNYLDHKPTEEDKVNLESGLTYIGMVGMIDPARPEVKESIKIATKAGIKTVMITGDHKVTAFAIAKRIL